MGQNAVRVKELPDHFVTPFMLFRIICFLSHSACIDHFHSYFAGVIDHLNGCFIALTYAYIYH